MKNNNLPVKVQGFVIMVTIITNIRLWHRRLLFVSHFRLTHSIWRWSPNLKEVAVLTQTFPKPNQVIFVPKPNYTLTSVLSHHKTYLFLTVICNGFGKYRQMMLSCWLLPIGASNQKSPLCVTLESIDQQCVLSFNLEELLEWGCYLSFISSKHLGYISELLAFTFGLPGKTVSHYWLVRKICHRVL